MRTELTQAHVDLKAAGILLAESTRTAERLRISRELHDLIGHQLTVLTLNLEAARHVGPDRAREHVARADAIARGLLRDVRSTVGELRTQPVDLQEALRSMVEGIPGLQVDIAVDPDLNLGEEQQVAFIRLAQEAVTNTIRHSEASRLQIDLAQDGSQVSLVARDDGIGARAPELGNGLCGLRERFESLGGELTVDGTAGFAVTGRVAA
ncbi:sensor histidine kinase [Brachybacterium sp. AOP29-B2-41]|uniref:sensor histidine kinase n=1 Tax=Brachybacterium sp. AOP29-B2-41 TaxID=3457704 RepID=UPI0040345E5B